ncbi:hypothetical protein BRADI_1g04097v3 [Brachypodium distachyon]|nr:hypothetical protein BRADI_1g04097v3 [Brachypodium distachyon]
MATDLFGYWKKIVIEETGKKNGTSANEKLDNSAARLEKSQSMKAERNSTSEKLEKSQSMKVEKNCTSANVKVEKNSTSASVKVEKNSTSASVKVEKNSSLASVKIEKNDLDIRVQKSDVKVEKIANNDSKVKVEMVSKDVSRTLDTKKSSSVPNGPPRLTSLVRCNDAARDKYRELLAEAFFKVSKETSKDDREEVRNLLDEVNACDPYRVSVTVESALFERLGRSTGAHKAKYRSILFNLKADNNPDFRRRVLLGEVRPGRLVDISPDEMASDARKLENKQIKEKALFDCERAGAPKATTDQFKCGRCGQRKTTYYQLQTRSADEPMTTFVTCVNCNNHWKFC